MPTPYRMIIVSLAAAALGLTACSSSEESAAPPPTSVPATSAPATSTPPSPSASGAAPSSAAPSSAAPAISITEAIDAALDEVDGAVLSADLDDDQDREWEVEVRRSATQVAELRIDAATGAATANRNDNDVDDEVRASAPRFSAAQAVRAAEQRVDGDAVQLDLGDDGATRTWEVTIAQSGPDAEVVLNADSGAFIRQQSDD